ncbi:MAG: hypothetical protein JW789_01815 [Candidatus Aenigmarchaeota archaeon]|nr:hypothetical protein [Candidatus Aenigmarchaeota archaeon]
MDKVMKEGEYRLTADDVKKEVRSGSTNTDPHKGFMHDMVVVGPPRASLNGEPEIQVDLWKLEGEGAERTYRFMLTKNVDSGVYRDTRQLERDVFYECFENREPGFFINKFIRRYEV